jgi:hypothetical protein
MILSAAQPYFAPFPGFFFKAHLSDVFVILDEVQFPRGTTWITRNRFKNHRGTLWLTIPVRKKGLGLQPIHQVRIYREGRWEKKHLESLKHAYARAPYFAAHGAFIGHVFSGAFEKLVDLNMAIIHHLLEHLEVHAKVILLSDLNLSETGDRRLVEICKTLGASRFLAQGAARKYLHAALFQEAGIALDFVTPPSPVYPQLWGDFIPNLSAFDLVFNCGPKAPEIMRGRP